MLQKIADDVVAEIESAAVAIAGDRAESPEIAAEVHA